MSGAASWTVVDAGGTTSVVAGHAGRVEHPSVNPASVGDAVAARTMEALFADVAAVTPPGGGVWFATAGLDPTAPDEELDRVRAAAAAVRFGGPVVVSSDIEALLLVGLLASGGRARWGAGAVAVVSGTGSGVRAGRLDGIPVTVGSREYLASDEGSAFAVAQDGLRAAVRAADGRGPASTLGDRFARRTGLPLDALVRDLARTPFPKTAVAALADVVIGSWQAGDAVAGRVVDRALDELQDAVQAGVRRAGLPSGWRAVLAGGVLTACAPLRAAFRDRLVAMGAADATPVSDPAVSLYTALTAVTDPVPGSWLGSAAWVLDLAQHGEQVRGRS